MVVGAGGTVSVHRRPAAQTHVGEEGGAWELHRHANDQKTKAVRGKTRRWGGGRRRSSRKKK